MAFEVCVVSELCALGWLDRVQIAVWRGSNAYATDVFYREMKAGISRFGSGVAHLAVIEPHTPLPPPEIRMSLVRAFKEHPTAVSAVSVAFEGQGFFASAIHSLATGLMLMANTRIPFRPCSSVADSVEFLSKHLTAPGAPLNPRICIDAVEELRRQLDRQRAGGATLQ